MAKGSYIGVSAVARKIKKMYIGVGGVAHAVKKAYIGVGGVAKLWWSGGGVYRAIINGYVSPAVKVHSSNDETLSDTSFSELNHSPVEGKEFVIYDKKNERFVFVGGNYPESTVQSTAHIYTLPKEGTTLTSRGTIYNGSYASKPEIDPTTGDLLYNDSYKSLQRYYQRINKCTLGSSSTTQNTYAIGNLSSYSYVGSLTRVNGIYAFVYPRSVGTTSGFYFMSDISSSATSAYIDTAMTGVKFSDYVSGVYYVDNYYYAITQNSTYVYVYRTSTLSTTATLTNTSVLNVPSGVTGIYITSDHKVILRCTNDEASAWFSSKGWYYWDFRNTGSVKPTKFSDNITSATGYPMDYCDDGKKLYMFHAISGTSCVVAYSTNYSALTEAVMPFRGTQICVINEN